MKDTRAPDGAKINKTQTEVKLHFGPKVTNSKKIQKSSRLKIDQKIKIVCFQHFCIYQKQLCHIYNPLNATCGQYWFNLATKQNLRTEMADVACRPSCNLKDSSTGERNKREFGF